MTDVEDIVVAGADEQRVQSPGEISIQEPPSSHCEGTTR